MSFLLTFIANDGLFALAVISWPFAVVIPAVVVAAAASRPVMFGSVSWL